MKKRVAMQSWASVGEALAATWKFLQSSSSTLGTLQPRTLCQRRLVPSYQPVLIGPPDVLAALSSVRMDLTVRPYFVVVGRDYVSLCVCVACL